MENALKTAFDWKVRKNLAAGKGEKGTQIIHFREAFHGRTGYTLSLTNTADPRKYMYFAKFDWPRIINPKLRFPVTEAVLQRVVAEEAQAIAEIEKAVRDNPDDIAALIIEPIQGEGGDNHFRPEFFHALRRLADEHDFMFIVDEVQTGLGATGRMWAIEHMGVKPDIIAFGKKAQVCGIIVGDRIDEVADNVFDVSSRINSTWGGNLVDMVRSQRYLEIIEAEDLVKNAQGMGELLLGGMIARARLRPDKQRARPRHDAGLRPARRAFARHLPRPAAGKRAGRAQVRRAVDPLPPDARPGQRSRGRGLGDRRSFALRRPQRRRPTLM